MFLHSSRLIVLNIKHIANKKITPIGHINTALTDFQSLSLRQQIHFLAVYTRYFCNVGFYFCHCYLS